MTPHKRAAQKHTLWEPSAEGACGKDSSKSTPPRPCKVSHRPPSAVAHSLWSWGCAALPSEDMRTGHSLSRWPPIPGRRRLKSTLHTVLATLWNQL